MLFREVHRYSNVEAFRSMYEHCSFEQGSEDYPLFISFVYNGTYRLIRVVRLNERTVTGRLYQDHGKRYNPDDLDRYKSFYLNELKLLSRVEPVDEDADLYADYFV